MSNDALVVSNSLNILAPQIDPLSIRPPIGHVQDLWDKALQSLSDEDKQQVDFSSSSKLSILKDVLVVVEEKKKLCVQSGWKIRKRNGESIPIRDIVDKIAKWVEKFKDVGDLAAQYDPAHAALPWAAVRFVLQVTINDSQTYGAMLEGLEYVSSLITRYAAIERLYLERSSTAADELANHIVKLYTNVLIYLSHARRYYARKPSVRIARSIVQTAESSVDTYLWKITEEDKNIYAFLPVMDAEFQTKMAVFLHSGLSHLSNKVDDLKDSFFGLQISMTAQKIGRDQILNWLHPVFTDDNYEGALSARLDGTCHWVLHRPEFQAWSELNANSDVTKFLWIHGSPGSGKTILSASTIHYLLSYSSTSVSFFFSVGEDESKRDPQTIVRSWVAQMIRKNDVALEAARETYTGKGTQPATQSDLWQLFRTISQRVQNCFYIIDGLDECAKFSSVSRAHTLDGRIRFLQELIASAAQTGSHVLIVSRYDADIRFHFKSNSTESLPDLFYEYEITREDTHNDIVSFSNHVVEQKLPNKSATLKQEIAIEAADKCDGMFLWIRLLNDRLSRGKNAKQLRQIVSETPAGLETAYDRDLKAIIELSEDERRRAMAILRWILFSSRPLTVKELTEALLVDADNDEDTFPADDLPDPCDEEYANDQILRLCGSLVDIRAREREPFERHTVHFVHFSVKEYLSQTSDDNCRIPSMLSFPNPNAEHDLLARTCLRYICYDDFKMKRHLTYEELKEKLEQYAFLSYASISWYEHSRRGKTDSQELLRLINRFFHPAEQRWLLWSDVFEKHQHNRKALRSSDGSEGVYGNPFYYAAMLGLVETLEYLQDIGVDVNIQGGLFGNALQASAAHGHHHIIEFLLKQKVDVNMRGGKYGTAIVAATAKCPPSDERKVIECLIDAGADVLSHDDDGSTPLHFAARSGDESIVKLLIDRGSDIWATNKYGETALFDAAIRGHDLVVNLLLARGADLKVRNKTGRTVLHSAVESNEADVVKVLLENKAELEVEDDEGWRALHLSAGTEGYVTTKLLLESGADLHAASEVGLTALHVAAAAKNDMVVRLLLERGADSSATMKYGSTPLHAGADGGSEAVLRALIDRGNIDLNVKDADGLTPLMRAVRKRHTAFVKLLLEQDTVDLGSKDGHGRTALFYAAVSRVVELVKLLSARTGDVDLKDQLGNTPLDYAAERVDYEVMNELLKQGAGFSAYAYRAALQTSPRSMRRYTMWRLEGIVPDAETWINEPEDILQIACMEGHIAFVELLLKSGANPNKVDEHGWTSLVCASHSGQDSILERLLSSGGDRSLLDQALTLSPTSWSEVVKSICLELDPSRKNVRYVVENSSEETEAGTVRADHPFPLQSSPFYFEITVVDGGERNEIAVGYSFERTSVNALPGWGRLSWGYHGDNGQLYSENGTEGKPYGETFSTGDVIGCQICLGKGVNFFKNGIFQGTVCKGLAGKIFPSLGIRSRGAHVRTNFGQDPFIYDVKEFVFGEVAGVIEEKSDSGSEYNSRTSNDSLDEGEDVVDW